MKVAILDDYFNTLRTLECFQELRDHDVTVWTEHTDDVEVLARWLANTEALVLIRERTAIRRALLERLDNVRLISLRSAYPHVDVATCTQLGIVVSSDMHQGSPSYATAELTWALILSGMRRLPQQVTSLRAGRWQESVGRTLRHQTLGVYGFGRIGEVVAEYGQSFGMRVLVWASASSRERASALGYEVAASREHFFETVDVLTVHQRLVDATRGTVTSADLGRMRETALFVNTSRAGLVESGALVEALRAGRPGSAALDVFDREPLVDVDDPLLKMDNVICTPHIGYVTRDEWEIQFASIFEQINAFAVGDPMNVVNPDVADNLARRPWPPTVTNDQPQ
jgi:D-3-phosphoglycerate dehydrogenase / 2-oxoglutarate reductase